MNAVVSYCIIETLARQVARSGGDDDDDDDDRDDGDDSGTMQQWR